MSNALRKLERNIVKDNIRKDGRKVKNCFESEWNDFRKKKYVMKDESDNVISDNTPRNTMKKKQHHFDNIEQYSKLFAYMEGLKKAKKEEVMAQ